MECPSCGTQNRDDASFCNMCKTSFRPRGRDPREGHDESGVLLTLPPRALQDRLAHALVETTPASWKHAELMLRLRRGQPAVASIHGADPPHEEVRVTAALTAAVDELCVWIETEQKRWKVIVLSVTEQADGTWRARLDFDPAAREP